MVAMAALLNECAPEVSPVLMQALVRSESSWRPFAIGMDKSQGAAKQPSSLSEAIATAKGLAAAGRKFSVGLAQIHVSNVALYGMTWEQAFDACQNLAVGQKILWNFYYRASASGYSGVAAVWAALRGYNSGSVDRAISDDYANRIFAYMSSAPAPVQISGALPLIRAPAGPINPSTVVATQGHPAKTQRSGESLDIFEKNRAGGF